MSHRSQACGRLGGGDGSRARANAAPRAGASSPLTPGCGRSHRQHVSGTHREEVRPGLPHRVAVLSTILGATATLVYAYATYMLFYLAYSLVNIPFGSLASAMTQLPDERARLSSSRTIGAAIAIIGLTVAVAPQISRAADLSTR